MRKWVLEAKMGDPHWTQYVSALLVPSVAVVGIALGVLNYRLSKQKREGELFDRRFEFYLKLQSYWMSSGQIAEREDRDPECHFEDLTVFAIESGFLFGNEISNHIMSLEGKGHYGSAWFPNEDFSKPFDNYLHYKQ
jgi:hypothetical protein